MTQHFDLIVIGSGPGGYKSAVIAAQLGAKVALIEKANPGGTCLNQGCVPKQALVKIAKLINNVKAFEGLGLKCSVTPDFSAALEHKNQLISSIRETVSPWLKRLGINLIHGHASFVNKTTVQIVSENIETQLLTSNRIIIATGSHPKSHPLLPNDNPFVIDSQQFMFETESLPKKLLCVGGGAIGSELAFVMHQFGSQVTIVENADRLLNIPSISDRASNALERKLRKIGINIKKKCTVVGQQTFDDRILIEFSDGSIESFDKVLVAIGRQANTNQLKLENTSVDLDEDGFIKTNEFLESNTLGIYAIGDVKAGPMTASAAYHDAKIAASNAIGGNQAVNNYHRVPIVIDSALQIASVGLTEDGAEEAGFEPDVARINMAGTTNARLSQDLEGFIEVVYDEETGHLLGGCIVGQQAREMIHTITAACQSDRGLWFFTDLNYAHPSWNEELENTIYQYVNMFDHSHEPIFQPGIYAIN